MQKYTYLLVAYISRIHPLSPEIQSTAATAPVKNRLPFRGQQTNKGEMHYLNTCGHATGQRHPLVQLRKHTE